MSIAETIPSEVDVEMARRFLQLVDANDTFTFQTFHDRPKGAAEDRALARVIPGPAGRELLNLHDRGAGVYFTVNRTDGAGRKGQNITNIRAVWQEDDDGAAVNFPIEPSLVVESSPGRFHRYWLLAEPWPEDERGRADHGAVMERMIESYGSDPNAKDLCRVLRVPGFLNRKHGDPHQVRVVSSPGWRYSRAEILAAFPPVARSQQTKAKANGAAPHSDPGRDDGEDQRIRDALFSVDASERHVWLTIGMAIEAHYGDAGRSLWDEWSATAPDKYSLDDQDRVWRSFKGSGVTIGTLFHYARHGGWEDDTKKLYEEWCRKQGGQPKDDDEAKSKYLLSARSISYFEDFNRALKLDWVIKNLFAREHTSYLIAPPGGGKSALLSSAVTYLGVGKDWRGFKIPKRCASVIIPLERGSLVKKRIWAESAREGLGEVPVAVSPGMIDLRSPKCVDEMVGTILQAEDRFGLEVALLNIDTFGKAIAAGGGDEDKAKDQNPAWGNLRRVHEAMARWHSIHVNVIGHTGKDQSRGARGSNAAEGDNDLLLQIRSDGPIKDVEIVKANELPEGPLMRFKMSPFNTAEVDEDGCPIEVWILDSEELAAAKSGIRRPLKPNQKTAYRILYDAGPQGLSQEDWNEQLRANGIGTARKADIIDIRMELKDRRLIREYAGRWFVDHKSEDPE